MEEVKPMYYTVQEVVAILRVSDATVRKYIKDKKIPFKQYGASHKILIPREAIDP